VRRSPTSPELDLPKLSLVCFQLIEIKYLDLTGLETDGKKLIFQFEQGGSPCEHTIRTDRLTELITHIRQQRRKHLPYAAFNVNAPSELITSLDEYKASTKTSPYLGMFSLCQGRLPASNI